MIDVRFIIIRSLSCGRGRVNQGLASALIYLCLGLLERKELEVRAGLAKRGAWSVRADLTEERQGNEGQSHTLVHWVIKLTELIEEDGAKT